MLRCSLSAEHHGIELVGWQPERGTRESSDALRHEVAVLLDSLARKRVCGSSRIRPQQIVSRVEQLAPQ